MKDVKFSLPVSDWLTKADTVALWHAVDDMAYMVRAMSHGIDFTPEQIKAERARLASAKRALRKANKIRVAIAKAVQS